MARDFVTTPLLLGLVIAAVATATGVAQDEASGGARTGGCPPKSSVLARTGTTAVVRRRQGGIVACLKRAPTSEVLTEEYFETFYRSPALAIKGTRVAYAVTNFEDPHDLVGTAVSVLDLGREGTDGSTVAPLELYGVFVRGTSIAVTRIVLRSDGAVAWTTCESDSLPPPVRVKPGGECSRPGRETTIFAVSSDGRRRKLADGKTVDPQWLRWQGNGRVAWRANGRTRSARLR